MKKKPIKKNDPLGELVDRADMKTPAGLIVRLGAETPKTRRECLEFLKKNVPSADDSKTEAEIVFTLWNELEPDLSDLDEYGGGDYGLQDDVEGLLYKMTGKLAKKKIPRDDRRHLLDEIFPYIKSDNAGMADALHEAVHAACYDDDDWRDLAKRFEALGEKEHLKNARDIYRKLGNREKYLSLRLADMEYGGDYHDLATYYWQSGEKEKALQVAREGLEKGKGRMDELRAFLSARAKSSGDRKGYIDLQFGQATDALSLKSYKTFKALCKPDEWKVYEPRLLSLLDKDGGEEGLKIRVFRQEYDQALSLLLKMRYPWHDYGGETVLKVAAQLEEKYPEEILKFYQSGLGTVRMGDARKMYAAMSRVALKVRHMWIDVIREPDKWRAFARGLKAENIKRPAFQEEFAKAIAEWKEL